MVSIARIERPPLHRGGSESTETMPAVSPSPSKLARFSLQGWGLIDLPLRVTFSPTQPRARRDVLLSQARASDSLYLSSREWPRLPSTARIERAQSYRARSASKEGAWPLPIPSSAELIPRIALFDRPEHRFFESLQQRVLWIADGL